jgi:hypothetical protein
MIFPTYSFYFDGILTSTANAIIGWIIDFNFHSSITAITMDEETLVVMKTKAK